MNRFINLKVSKSYNFLIINKDSNYSNNSQKYIDFSKFPHALILNNLIIFLYKKLTPFLFQEVKNYLNIQYRKYKNKTHIKKTPHKSLNEKFFNNIKREINYPLKDKNNKLELTNKSAKTNYQNGKKAYIPKSEQKKNYSGKNKYKNFEKRRKINLSHANGRKDINEITSIKTKKINDSKSKNILYSKKNREYSRNSSKNNSISNSRDTANINYNQIINTNSYNYKKKEKSKKTMANIISTNNNKNYLLNKNNKIHSSSKNKNHLINSHPFLNDKFLYQLSFNNNYNCENNNNTYYNKNNGNGINCSLKKNKNNIKIFKGNYIVNNCNKNIKKNQTTRKQNPLSNIIKQNNYTNKSNSYSTLNKNNKINKNQINNYFEQYHINIINGGEKKNINDNNSNKEQNNIIINNEEKVNNINNKKYKLLNEEMMKKIKNTIDDNLKVMFNFSYENFLSKESEQESKEYSFEKSKNFEDRNNLGEIL